MSKFTLLILCAGFGKRMLNLTTSTPKPLLQVKNQTLLSNTINFFKDIGCNEIFINTHYLHQKIATHINNNFKDYPVNLIFEPSILGTGGGVKNIFNYTESKSICVVNSDIFWQKNNKPELLNFIEGLGSVTHCKILLAKKNNFLGLKNTKGDFNIEKNVVSNWIKGKEIIYYSGFQILSKNIFKNTPKIFSMNQVWNNLIINKNLKGHIIQSKILHLGDKSSFEEL